MTTGMCTEQLDAKICSVTDPMEIPACSQRAEPGMGKNSKTWKKPGLGKRGEATAKSLR
jgi:hypothetical protein